MAGLQADTTAPLAALSEVAAHPKHDSFDEKKNAEHESVEDHAPLQEHEPDGIHDGLEFPTDEERATLRRVADSIPWNAYRTFLVQIILT